MQLKIKSQHKENSRAWWDEKFSSQKSPSKEPSAFLLEALDLFPAQAKVLEIACGEGRNSVAMSARGFEVTAMDFSSVALERAQALAKSSGTNIHFKSQDLDFYLPELLSFDAIVSIQFRPSAGLVKNLSRGLKQKGLLVMEAPLMESAKKYESIETFECYKPNELLQLFSSQLVFQILQYSELNPGHWGENAFLLARKAQLL